LRAALDRRRSRFEGSIEVVSGLFEEFLRQVIA
jgi:hypothetical protein